MLQWGHVVVDVEGLPSIWASVDPRYTASMGPRRRRRGRRRHARWLASFYDRLQWGHVVVDVEGVRGGRARDWLMEGFNGATSSSTWKVAKPPADTHPPRWLQWGHVVVDVEGRGQRGNRQVVGRASMGPRRRRRGRGLAGSMVPGMTTRLQWGHVVVDVEGSVMCHPSPARNASFNGATSSSTWKVESTCAEVSTCLDASMGPRRRRRGRAHLDTGTVPATLASMGPRRRRRGRISTISTILPYQ